LCLGNQNLAARLAQYSYGVSPECWRGAKPAKWRCGRLYKGAGEQVAFDIVPELADAKLVESNDIVDHVHGSNQQVLCRCKLQQFGLGVGHTEGADTGLDAIVFFDGLTTG
jgi:hypothetical protein